MLPAFKAIISKQQHLTKLKERIPYTVMKKNHMQLRDRVQILYKNKVSWNLPFGRKDFFQRRSSEKQYHTTRWHV